MTGLGAFIVSLIVAVAENGVIGRDGKLPWRLGSDLRRFRKLTMGHPLIMGRKTFEAIGKPLDGRDNIVVTRGAVPERALPDGVFLAPSLDAALTVARRQAKVRGVKEVFVIGGADLFAQALPNASRIYLTRVHATPEGDVRFEPPQGGDWAEVSREDRPAGERDEFPVTDVILERRN